MLLLDSAHHHAHVLRFDHHRTRAAWWGALGLFAAGLATKTAIAQPQVITMIRVIRKRSRAAFFRVQRLAGGSSGGCILAGVVSRRWRNTAPRYSWCRKPAFSATTAIRTDYVLAYARGMGGVRDGG